MGRNTRRSLKATQQCPLAHTGLASKLTERLGLMELLAHPVEEWAKPRALMGRRHRALDILRLPPSRCGGTTRRRATRLAASGP